MDEELVYKALADASRRRLLDVLFARDGQTLSELQGHLTSMTRFGVMKHLQVLEDAGLVSTRKVGREKFHYLNPVPIQQAYDRWVSKYAQPWSQALTGLKSSLEDKAMSIPNHVYSIFIRSTPERIWQALTDGGMTEKYYFGTRVESTWQPGAEYQYVDTAGGVVASGEPMLCGKVLESDPPRRLVTTFIPMWMGDAAGTTGSKVTFEIEPRGDACKLTLTHEDLGAGHLTAEIIDGWATVCSGMKTLLETGDVLVVAQGTM